MFINFKYFFVVGAMAVTPCPAENDTRLKVATSKP